MWRTKTFRFCTAFVLLLCMNSFCAKTAQAQVVLVLNTPPQLPERVNDWERLNALFSVTVTNTGRTPLQRLRIAATVTNMDNNAVLFRTKNDLTRPFNAPPGLPQTLTAPQILPANSFEYDASVQTALIRTNTLPEGAYRLCVRVIDERGATLGMEQCRTFNVIIPDPPSLISPANGDSVRRAAPSVPLLPQFQWTPVFARFGQQSRYKLRVVPIFEGQQPRQALEGNPALVEKIVPTSSYQWLPSDAQFSNYPNAKGFAWQVQAVEGEITTAARAVGRNEGKSEIFTFGVPVPTSQVTSGAAPPTKGSKIKVGEFTMTLGDFTPNQKNGTISGKGTIQIDWLKTAIKVRFDGITVTNNVLVNGEVLSEQSDGVPSFKDQLGSKMNLPDVPSGVNLSLGLGSSNLKDIYEKAKAAISQIGKGAITLPLGYETAAKTMFALSAMKFTKDDAQMNMLTRVPMPSLGPDAALTLGAGEISFLPSGPKLSSFALFLAQDFAVPSSYKLTFLAPSQGTKGTLLKVKSWSIDEFAIGGKMEFPTTWFTKASDGASAVTGTFSGSSKSLTAWIVSASIPDECNITNLPDFKLKIDDLSFDMSDKENPPGLVLPPNYGNGVQWRGFAIKKATMTLPPYLKKFDSDSLLTLELSNFLIDGGGLTGTAQIAQKLDNINFGGFKGSIETFKVAFVTMSPKEVSLGGTLTLPVGDATIGVVGVYAENQGFSMAANLAKDKTFQIGSAAEFMLYGKNDANSAKAVTIAFNKTNGATASLSGQFTLKSGFGADVQGTDMSFKGIAFEGVKLSPQGAKVFELGKWSYVNKDNQTKSFGKANGKDDIPSHLPSHLSDEELANFVSDEVERFYAGGKHLDLESAPMLAPDGNDSKEGLGGFPISIESLSSSESGNKTTINVALKLNLDGDGSSSGLSGTTTLAISFDAVKGKPMKFENADMSVKGITLDATLKGVVRLVGGVEFYSNKTTNGVAWGSGFFGALDATLVDLFTIRSAVQFGSLGKQRYWFVDVSHLNKSVALASVGALGLYGVGGTVYSNMVLTPASGYGTPPQKTTPMTLGQTFSGMKLKPSAEGTSALGGSINVMLGTTPTPQALNGNVLFGITFENDAFKQINIMGDINMMTEIGTKSQLAFGTANFTFTRDITTGSKVFHGEMGFKVLVPPGNGSLLTIDGMDPTPKLQLHFAGPNDWYIKLGTPDNRISSLFLSGLTADGYLMMGKNLPKATLPNNVKNILGGSFANNAGIGGGDGFGFGMSQSISIPPGGGRASFLIFYAHLAAEYGFDVALKNTNGASCAGSNGPLGINGWYASGQAYAYLTGAIGLHVDLWLVEGDFEILRVAAAAALQAQLPNPTWLKGAVAGEYSILDGLVAGSCRFEFEIGEKCQIVSDPLATIKLITDVQPPKGATDVSTMITPAIAFALKVNTAFDVQTLDNNGNTVLRTFRFVLDPSIAAGTGISLLGPNGQEVEKCTFQWSASKTSVIIIPPNELSATAPYTILIKARGQEKIQGQWVNAKDEKGVDKGLLEEAYTFTTGQGALTVADGNVTETTPGRGQRFYLQDFAKLATIQLKIGQSAAFADGKKNDYVARITQFGTMQGVEIPLGFIKSGLGSDAVKTIVWAMPDLLTATTYKVEIIRKAPQQQKNNAQTTTLSQNVLSDYQSKQKVGAYDAKTGAYLGDNVSNTSLVQRRVFGGPITAAAADRTIYTFYFRTSKYKTLQAKFDAVKPVIAEAKKLVPYMKSANSLDDLMEAIRIQLRGGFLYYERSASWPPSQIAIPPTLPLTIFCKEEVLDMVAPFGGKLKITTKTCLPCYEQNCVSSESKQLLSELRELAQTPYPPTASAQPFSAFFTMQEAFDKYDMQQIEAKGFKLSIEPVAGLKPDGSLPQGFSSAKTAITFEANATDINPWTDTPLADRDFAFNFVGVTKTTSPPKRATLGVLPYSQKSTGKSGNIAIDPIIKDPRDPIWNPGVDIWGLDLKGSAVGGGYAQGIITIGNQWINTALNSAALSQQILIAANNPTFAASLGAKAWK